MLLVDVASASSEVGAVSSRLAKISRIATLLGAAASSGDADQVAVVVSWLSGELPQRQIGVGWAALRTLPQPADEPTLTVAHVDAAFTEIGAVAGTRSQKHRVALAGRCSPQRPRPSRRSCVVFCKVSCARAHWPA